MVGRVAGTTLVGAEEGPSRMMGWWWPWKVAVFGNRVVGYGSSCCCC